MYMYMYICMYIWGTIVTGVGNKKVKLAASS